jgi:hypothetical protein
VRETILDQETEYVGVFVDLLNGIVVLCREVHVQAVRHIWALVVVHRYGVKIEEKHTLVFTMATTSVITTGCLDNGCYGNHVSRDTRIHEVRGQLTLDRAWDSACLPLTIPRQFLDPDGLPVYCVSMGGTSERSELSPSAFWFQT